MDNNNNLNVDEIFDASVNKNTYNQQSSAYNVNGYQPVQQSELNSTMFISSPVQGTAVLPKKSKAPVVVTMLVLFVAGMAAMFGYYALTGGFASAYERAERNSLSLLAGGFSQAAEALDLYNSEILAVSEEGSIKATLGKDFISLLDAYGMGDIISAIGTVGMDYSIISDGTDIYIDIGAEVMSISLSAAMWMFEESILMQFPELSDAFLFLGEYDMNEIMNVPDGYDADAAMTEFAKIMNKTLDEYFTLTKNAPVTKGVELTGGAVTVTADNYGILIDGYLVAGVIKAFFEAVLDNPVFLEMCEENFSAMASMNMYYGYNSFQHLARELIGMLDDMSASELAMSVGSMNVYVSGNTVVKREIKIPDAGLTVSFGTLTDGAAYSKHIEARVSSYWSDTIIRFTDNGSDGSGSSKDAVTGKAVLSVDDGNNVYIVNVNYSDLKMYDNGMFSGSLDISMPLPAEMIEGIAGEFAGFLSGSEIKFAISAAVNDGDKTQNIRCDVFFLSMQVMTIDIQTRSDTGKSFTKPDTAGKRIYDVNDYDGLYDFSEELEAAFESMLEGLMSSNPYLEDIFGSLSSFGSYDYYYEDEEDYDYNRDYDYNYDWADGGTDFDYTELGYTTEHLIELYMYYMELVLGEDWDWLGPIYETMEDEMWLEVFEELSEEDWYEVFRFIAEMG